MEVEFGAGIDAGIDAGIGAGAGADGAGETRRGQLPGDTTQWRLHRLRSAAFEQRCGRAPRSKGQPLPLGTPHKYQPAAEPSDASSVCPSGTKGMTVTRGAVSAIAASPTAPAASANTAAPQATRDEQAVERAVAQSVAHAVAQAAQR